MPLFQPQRTPFVNDLVTRKDSSNILSTSTSTSAPTTVAARRAIKKTATAAKATVNAKLTAKTDTIAANTSRNTNAAVSNATTRPHSIITAQTETTAATSSSSSSSLFTPKPSTTKQDILNETKDYSKYYDDIFAPFE